MSSFNDSIYKSGKANIDTNIINYRQNFTLTPINQSVITNQAMYLIGHTSELFTIKKVNNKNDFTTNMLWQFFEIKQGSAAKMNDYKSPILENVYGLKCAKVCIKNSGTQTGNFLGSWKSETWRMDNGQWHSDPSTSSANNGNAEGPNLDGDLWVNEEQAKVQATMFLVNNINVNRNSGEPAYGMFDVVQIIGLKDSGTLNSETIFNDEALILVCQDDVVGGDGLIITARISSQYNSGKAMYWKKYKEYKNSKDTYLQIGPGTSTISGMPSTLDIPFGYYPNIPKEIYTQSDIVNLCSQLSLDNDNVYVTNQFKNRTICLPNSKKHGKNQCMNIYLDNIIGHTCRTEFVNRQNWTPEETNTMNYAFIKYCNTINYTTHLKRAPSDWDEREDGKTEHKALSLEECRKSCSDMSNCSAFTTGGSGCTIYTSPMNIDNLGKVTESSIYDTYIKNINPTKEVYQPGDVCYCVNKQNNQVYKDMQGVFNELIDDAQTTANEGMYTNNKNNWNQQNAFCMLSSCRNVTNIDIRKTNSETNIAGNVQYLPGISGTSMETYVCPAINIQQCTQLFDLQNDGKISGNVNLNATCNQSVSTGEVSSGNGSSKRPSQPPAIQPSDNKTTENLKTNNTVIYIIIGVIILLLLIVTLILFKLMKKSKVTPKVNKYGKRR